MSLATYRAYSDKQHDGEDDPQGKEYQLDVTHDLFLRELIVVRLLTVLGIFDGFLDLRNYTQHSKDLQEINDENVRRR